MKKNIFSAIMAMLMLVCSLAFVACGEDQLDTNQFTKPVSLLAFGPSPVARGGELRIIGTGLDKVTSVTIPGCGDISDITRVSSEEIRVTVPQDAQPGKIAIRTSSQSFESVSVISYTEPVGFAETNPLTPTMLRPGQELIIKGEYLNLVQAVIFAEGVKVPVEKPSRSEIRVIVPDQAQTGKIAISFCATGDTIPNEIYCKEVLEVILPSIEEVANLTGKKPGDEITQKGADLNLVDKLTVAGQEVEFSVANSAITYKLPANTPSEATVTMYAASGVGVVIATIGMQLPSGLAADPATDVWAGKKITVTGKDLDVVANVTFPGVENPVSVSNQSATSLTVTVPAGTQSGNMVLNCKSGASVSVAIKTLKPSFESYSANPVISNDDITINGANLNLVAQVQFAGIDPIEVKPSADAITVFVPTTAEAGEVTMIMTNGETVQFPSLKISAPLCAYVVDQSVLISTEDAPMRAGCVVGFEANNIEHITSITIDGEACPYTTKENKVYVVTPESAGPKSKMDLISDNGHIEYAISLIPNSEIVTTLWKGAAELAWSGEGQVYLGADGGADLVAAGAKAGDILRIQLSPLASDWQVQIWEGHWGVQYDEIKAANYDLEGNGGYYNITLTDDLIKTFTTSQGWGGIVLTQGQQCIVTALELVQKISMEETVWQGEEDLGSWSNQPYIGAEGILVEMGAKVGQKLKMYVKPLGDDWMVQTFYGHWDGQFGGDWTAANCPENIIEIPITNDNIGQLTSIQNWGGVFVVQGQNAKIVKLTLE